MDYTALLPRACEAVLEAGAFIRREKATFDRAHAELKGHNDLVSYVDRTAEDMLRDRLTALTPGCGFLNEETGAAPGANDLTWIIDPLDGTTNFVFDVPVFSVSVGLAAGDTLAVGLVYDVMRDELFTAARDAGAYANGRTLRVSGAKRLEDGLLATGFPHRDFHTLEDYLKLLGELFRRTRGLRRMGSAAIDLAYTACGRFDGFFEANLSPWDVAAGALLVQEAGGVVTDYHGGGDYLHGRSIVAGGAGVHPQLLAAIAASLSA